jgi:hypothetical protein
MIQPQLLDITPNMRAHIKPAAANGPSRPARAKTFEDMLNKAGVAPAPPPGYSDKKASGLGGRAEDNAAWPDNPEPLAQPAEAPASLYLFCPITPPTPAPLDFLPGAEPPKDPQILANLISIPEGKQSNILFNKEIVPLLTRLQQALGQLEQPLPPEFEQMLAEVMARMPQTGDITETPPQPAELSGLTVTPRGNSCPPGNVNEEPGSLISLRTEPLPASGPASGPAAAAPPDGQAADEEFYQDQTSAKEYYSALPEGASFSIAPARLASGERFSAAAAQAARPLTADNLFNAMVERIVSLPEANPHMEISLKPDHLGKLSIDLQWGENGLSAKIFAGNEGTRNLLAAQIQRLSDTLAERGIRVESVEVIYSALGDAAFGQRQPAEQEARGNARQSTAPSGLAGGLASGLASGLAEASNGAPWENVYEPPFYADDPPWALASVEYLA